MIIRNDNDLIGDFIGTIPAMQAVDALYVIKPQMVELASMARIEYTIVQQLCDKEFDLHNAFAFAASHNLHMIQANFRELDLPVPRNIPRPELTVITEPVPVVDYVLSPFSRSLPESERWEKWQELIDSMADKRFALIGGMYDDEDYLTGCLKIFNRSLNYISNVLLNSKGLISVVTGTSHLAYALGVKNYLFCSQGAWGKNPEAIHLANGSITDVEVKKVIDLLK
jgi:ADP-heptose:LPS heptosyltransferase